MVLAKCLRDHYVLTRAELQRYFGLDIGRMGSDFSALHAACCLHALPLGSRLLAALDPAMGWGVTDYKLHDILQVLAGHEIPYPWEEAARVSTSPGLPSFGSMEVEDLKALLKRKQRTPEGGE